MNTIEANAPQLSFSSSLAASAKDRGAFSISRFQFGLSVFDGEALLTVDLFRTAHERASAALRFESLGRHVLTWEE